MCRNGRYYWQYAANAFRVESIWAFRGPTKKWKELQFSTAHLPKL
jgi:hypothetical protein